MVSCRFTAESCFFLACAAEWPLNDSGSTTQISEPPLTLPVDDYVQHAARLARHKKPRKLDWEKSYDPSSNRFDYSCCICSLHLSREHTAIGRVAAFCT